MQRAHACALYLGEALSAEFLQRFRTTVQHRDIHINFLVTGHIQENMHLYIEGTQREKSRTCERSCKA